MTLSSAVTRLFEIEHPIVGAPMDTVAGGELAAAISDAGGLGLIGGGYGDRTWLSRAFDAAAGARVGCGFITWSLAQDPELLGIALAREPVAVMLSFGDPAPFADEIISSGAWLLCQIQNRGQAERALQVGADVLVAQGSEAGGHGYGPRSTLTLVPEIVDLVTEHGRDTPVLAAGGIADGRGLAAALSLGAAGALVGTRFYAATEARSTAAARERVAAATGDDTCRTDVYDLVRDLSWPSGHTMSVLSNRFTDRWRDATADLTAELDAVRTQYRRALADRDYATANVTVGQAAGLVHTEQTAAEIVTRLVTDAARALDRARGRG